MSVQAISDMLQTYHCNSTQDCAIALREIMQSIALLALSRGDFFNQAAFYGGTALRLLYGLNRGSEDMDFSLLTPNMTFSLNSYAIPMETEFASFGLHARFKEKIKMKGTNIRSGFLKSNTQSQLLSIGLDESLAKQINAQREIRIKIEVDVQPPPAFQTEINYLYQPIPFALRSYTLPNLLAGKLHAVLFRNWKSRVKGRDWYDLAWYAGKHPFYNLQHLEARARQSSDYTESFPLTAQTVSSWLHERLEKINLHDLKVDVLPFLKNPSDIDHWSKDFFHDVFRRLRPSPLSSN